MKNLKLENACSEQWDAMTVKGDHNYCDLCAKNVIDFTRLSDLEISKLMKKSGDSICARVTSSQLNNPLIDGSSSFTLGFPQSKVAAGLMLATALTMSPAAQANSKETAIELVESVDDIKLSRKRNTVKNSTPAINNTTAFTGVIIFKETGEYIEHAKVTLVTASQVFTTYTLKDGTFTLEIPTQFIDYDNVVRVSYNDCVRDENMPEYENYETKDYILTKEQLDEPYLIKATLELHYLGGLGYSYKPKTPIVLKDGARVKYRDFRRARAGKKSSCSLKNKDYMYFENEYAIAIYGKKARHGLYIITDKE